MDRIRSFLNLERGEEALASLLFAYLALIMGAYIITQAIRDGLFLHKFSAFQLPYVYLAIAALISFVVWVYFKVSAGIGQSKVIVATLLFFILNILLQWWAVRRQWAPVTWIFYVWTSIFGIIVITQVWTVANQVLDLRQAKRLFPLISSGAILGSTLGGFSAARLVRALGTDNLMLLLIPLLVLAGIFAQILLSRHSHSRAPQGKKPKPINFSAALKTIQATRYLKLIVLLLALSNIVTMVVGIQFSAVVQHTFPLKNDITHFMGLFKGSFSLLSFLLQVLAGSWLVSKFGVKWMILVLPVALMGGTLVLMLFPLALWAGTVLKASDHTLRYSVDRSTTELLYLPLPQATKSEIKAVIDMVFQRVADGVGALVVLFVRHALKGGQVSLCVLDLILLALWLGVALLTRREYVQTLLNAVIQGRDLGREVIKNVFDDSKSLPSIRTLLASRDEEVVLLGMKMAQEARHLEWIPRELITSPSERVRARALEVLNLTDQELLDRAEHDSSSTIRASAILNISRRSSTVRPSAGMSPFLQSPEIRVRLSALIAMVRGNGNLAKGAVTRELERISRDLDPASKQWKEVAECLGQIAHPEGVELHVHLLQHRDPAVRKEAILSAGRTGQRELVPFLVPLLRDAAWAPEVRLTLREYGQRILGTLADTLRDPSEDLEVRRSIPLVLAYVPAQASVGILLDALSDYDGLVRYRSIRALGKLRLVDPDLRFDAEKIIPRIRDDGEKAHWFQHARVVLYAQNESQDLLFQLCKDKFERGKDRVFRLLALMLPPHAALGSIWVIREGDPLAKAKAIELLDNLLPGRLKEVVLPLIEQRSSWRKPEQTPVQILTACLNDPDPILRDCAADALGKGRWPEAAELETLLARNRRN